MHFLRLVIAVGCLAQSAGALERIEVAPDQSGFVSREARRPFRIWGVNYDHDTLGEHGRLIEDYWVEEWDTVVEDFREIKDLGANVVRVHIQFGKFMHAPEQPNEGSLAQLRKLLSLAEDAGIYLNLTGLGCYHKQDVPEWYDRMAEGERWKAQAEFWRAVARACRHSPAVFCYDLMNEPIASGGKSDGWLTGELGGKHFVQRLTLTPGDRDARQIARAWLQELTSAIREEDPDRLITVGVIPWALTWPNAKPIFYSPETREFLDFVSVHFYPKKGEIDKALAALAVYDIGKPLVIEEMFPLNCGFEEMDEFIRRSRERVEGYFSFYWGKTAAEYDRDGTLVAAIMTKWLNYFQDRAVAMKRPDRADPAPD